MKSKQNSCLLEFKETSSLFDVTQRQFGAMCDVSILGERDFTPLRVAASMSKTVAIIGAGASGLAAIKSCLEVGLEPTAFESDPWLGGAWMYTDLDEGKNRRSCVSYSTVTNTSKHMSCYSDFPMPKEWPNYLKQQKYLEYFQMYAKEFGLEERIRFDTTVFDVKPATDLSQRAGTDRWQVYYRDHKQNERVEEFDFVMVCTGVNWDPRTSSIPGLDGFAGDVIHSRDYRTWKNFEGKRVVVVGMGNSAGLLKTN